MKKILCIILISIYIITMMTGCNKKTSSENTKLHESENSQEIVKIMENVYVDYVNDIYLDSSKYANKIIEIEGMFKEEIDEENQNHLYVYRLTDVMEHIHDESQHTDGDEDDHMVEIETMIGFEFSYDDNLPKENDWIKVIGTLEEKDGNLIINADSVKIMEDRGMEKVKQFY